MAFKTEAHVDVAYHHDDVTINYVMVQSGRKHQDITAAVWMSLNTNSLQEQIRHCVYVCQ